VCYSVIRVLHLYCLCCVLCTIHVVYCVGKCAEDVLEVFATHVHHTTPHHGWHMLRLMLSHTHTQSTHEEYMMRHMECRGVVLYVLVQVWSSMAYTIWTHVMPDVGAGGENGNMRTPWCRTWNNVFVYITTCITLFSPRASHLSTHAVYTRYTRHTHAIHPRYTRHPPPAHESTTPIHIIYTPTTHYSTLQTCV
jgi:hypothetical protein